jgi:predicted PurR-regulated permease PerM
MPADSPGIDTVWFNRERALIIALGLATFLALYVCFLIIQPFMPAVAMAVAVAVATKRPHNWLRLRVRSHTVVASLSVVLVACVILLPLSLLITNLVRQVIDSAQQLPEGGGPPDWQKILHLTPAMANALDWAEANLDLHAQLARLTQNLADQAGSLVTGSMNLLTQFAILLFVLFFLYRDRDHALASLRTLAPLSDSECNRMLDRIESTILAIVNGSLTVAFVQSLLAGVMYTVLGVPAPMIWASVTFIVAIIPVFGTFMVWGPIALFLLVFGSWIKALILIGWGMLVVGTIDNLLYPHLVGEKLRLHTLPTFFAIVGGVLVFGPAGLILGPVAVAVTLGLLDVWWWRTAGGRSAEHAALDVAAH